MKVQFIVTPAGEEMAVLPRVDFERLIDAAGGDAEDAADLAMFDQRMAELEKHPAGLLPAEVSSFLLKGDSRLKAMRKWRGLSQIELSTKAGIGQGYLSEIESGRKAGAPETIDALASALDVPREWIG